MPEDMIKTIREAVEYLNLGNYGINTDLVGVHSLHTGRAMALKLQEESDITIMKMERWTSLTFL